MVEGNVNFSQQNNGYVRIFDIKYPFVKMVGPSLGICAVKIDNKYNFAIGRAPKKKSRTWMRDSILREGSKALK